MKEKACSVCMANCVRLHGDADEDPQEKLSPTDSSGPVLQENGASGPSHQKNNLPTEIFPSFLKRMTEVAMSSALQMPASFVKTSVANIGPAVTLEGPGKGRWRVEIGPGKENHSLEFRDGWQKFVADHVLQIGDQLSFTLTAGSHFQVVVYDGSGSQKVSASDATNSPVTHQLNEKGVQVGAVAQVRPKPVSRPKQKVRRKLKTEGATQSVKVVPPLAQSSESELRNSNTPVTKSKEAASVENSENEPDIYENHLLLLPPHVMLDGHVISERRPVTAEEKERALNAANAYPISNPRLVVVMSKGFVYRGFWMALSRPFAKAYMPQETRDVTLLNMAGNQWTVKWLFKESGSGFSGGWRGFSLDHRLEESDVCVLELLDAKNFIILVHIFRVIGSPKEDLGDYRPAPGRARNAGQTKRKMVVPDSSHPGPSSSNKCSNKGTPDSSAKYSKVENLDHSQWQTPAKVEQLSCSKRAPRNSAKAVVTDDETVAHKGKKVKCSPTTSGEVYAEYVSFVTPPSGVVIENEGTGALNLEVRPLNSKQATTDNKVEASRESLVKLGKELAGQQTATKFASPSLPSHSDGSEKMQNGSPIPEKENVGLREACECTH